MGVSELAKAEENDSGSCENFNENQINNVKVEQSQEEKEVVIVHDVQNSIEDREEGEIVDDYEFIISSDEEFCMRQRIEELEATNAELEKIAKISGNSEEYNFITRKDSQVFTFERFPLASIDLVNAMDCQRAAQVPTDASSISSVEFSTPKKRKRRKSKASRGNARVHKQQTTKHEQKQRTEIRRSDHKKRKHILKRTNMVYLHSDKDLEAHSNSYESSDLDGDDNYSSGCYLSREELRLAVTRFSNSEMNSGNLKARLEKDKNRNTANEISEKNNICMTPKKDHSIQTVIVDDESSDSVSLEEQELRLIALKSAVMKKHLARKKRDAEVAYSPTDFEDVLANTSYAIRDDEMDVVEVEMDELEHSSRNSMEISPVASPKLHLSTEEEENSRMSMATEINEVNEVENTKLVDMDIANSDSEEELPSYDNFKEKWLPLDQIPLPTVRESKPVLCQNPVPMVYDGILYPPSCTTIQYTSFLPEHPVEPSPLPPGITFFEEQPPPPPPFHLGNLQTKLKDLYAGDKHNDSSSYRRNSRQIYAHNKVKIERLCTSAERSKSKLEKVEDDYDDEEEEALRALLLSKFNSPKVCKPKTQKANIPSKENVSNDDPDELRGLLLTSIDERKSSQNPTESILKEAVRRLKLKTIMVNSECVEEDGDNKRLSVLQNSQSCSPVEIQTNDIRSNELAQSTGSSGNGKALKTSEAKNGSLRTPAFKEIQCHSRPSNYCPIENSSAEPKIDIKKSLVTVRSVEKINETYNLERNVNAETCYKSKNDEKTIEIQDFKKILNTVEASCVDEVLHSNVNLANKDQIIPHETISSIPDERSLNEVKNINTCIVENQADTNDNNLSKVLHEFCVSGNTINAVHAGEKHEVVSPNLVTDGLSKEKSLKDTINKTTSTLNTEQTLLAGLDGSPSTSTASQAFLSKKIIKPNKVINTLSEMKRKSQDVVKVPVKILKIASKSDSPQTTSSTYSNLNNSRLITSTDISNVQVKKLIISLRASETESSDEEFFPLAKSSTISPNKSRFETIEPLVCTINNDYYDNASPISLPMDSPGITPKRANSPSGELLVTDLGITKSFVNDCFKKKLDTFLKNVRTQVQQAVSQPIKSIENEKPKSNTSNSKNFSTPVAVRHLPQASQQEYRRLVHRMQLLEKQKELKSNEKATTVTNTTSKECANSQAHTNNKDSNRLLQQKVTLESKQTAPSQEFSKASNGNTLFKKVLLKNANYTATTPKSNHLKSVKKSSAQQQPSKSNVLRAYENSFLKTGNGILTNLDKSLQLVEEAKQAKMAKLQHEKRLQELRIEMDEIQHKLRQAQQKIANIYPEICESNEVITTLKQRRSKLLKAATSLGNFIKGDEYRLNNDLKQQITMKSKTLAAQIKLVNSMQYSDVVKVKEMSNQSLSSENSDINQNPSVDKELVGEYEKKTNENMPPLNETVLDEPEQKKSLLKDSTTLLNNTTENVPKDSDLSICNNDETPGPNEEIETQERALKDVHEKNDAISKEVVKFVKNISEKDDTSTSTEERKMVLIPEYISPLLPLKTTKRHLDPNGIICPYDLMGKCEDKDCSYVHISAKSLDET